jgi:hypothetical protein
MNAYIVCKLCFNFYIKNQFGMIIALVINVSNNYRIHSLSSIVIEFINSL